ncbi:MAG TPA: diacylglycerol kinase family protein, partial [Terracidiphilus sp.]|nr:diacylglycerol kinase family protein [Terracidiphilus sp.]
MRRVMMFLNPLLIHNARRRSAVEQIAELLSEHGCDVHLQETLSAHSAGQQAEEAVAAGFDTFLVCGGDGTVFEVIQGLAGSDAALGVLPFGTGNVIAQNLRLPRNPLAAAKLLLGARVRPVSLGQINLNPVGHKRMRSWYFFIAAGMGVHAALM